MSVRLIFWIVLIWGAFMLLRRFQRRSNAVRQTHTSTPSDSTAIDMVRCAHCGMHLSRNHAVTIPSATGPTYYCSTEHARL